MSKYDERLKARFQFDENNLTDDQKKAAVLLVEYEFTPKADRLTKEEIAEMCNVTRMGLWKWDTQNPDFIGYKKYLSAQFLDSYTPMVYARLAETIDKRFSVRAMELFMKRLGDLNDNQEITITDQRGNNTESFDERQAELLARLGEGEGKAEGNAEEKEE